MEPREVPNSQTTGSMKSWPEPTPASAPPRRNLDQNALMWALLSSIASQVQWPVDGEMQWLTTNDWKVLLTAGLKREQRIAKGIWGGFVMLGTPTSRMTKSEFSELVELIYAFGAEHSVKWSHD